MPRLPTTEAVERQVSQMMRSSRPDPPKNPAGSVYRHASEVDEGVSLLPEEVYKKTSRGRCVCAPVLSPLCCCTGLTAVCVACPRVD